MKNLLFDIVSSALLPILDIEDTELNEKLELPPQPQIGDVALPCFFLAKAQKKAPNLIAQNIKSALENNKAFEQVVVQGGYVNFFLNKQLVMQKFFEMHKSGALLSPRPHQNQNALIEHTSINPNASPHIGRARNALIGDASARLLKYLGYNTKVHYFVNDIGKQIALLVYHTEGKTNIKFQDLLELYVSANEALKDSPEVEEKVFELLHQMESGNKQAFEKFARIVNICINGQKAIFNEFGIFYDEYNFESGYVQSGRTKEILSALEKTKYLFTDDAGRKVLNLQEFNINSENPYFPLTRKDGTSLYPLRDVCYSIDKSIWAKGKNVIVLGEDQKLYGKQINAVLDILGYQGAEIVNYSFVLLADGKMSTRAGKVVLLEDLMRTTKAYAQEKIAEKGGIATPELAKALGYGAIKYAILKCSNDRNVVFDPAVALSFEGNTSVYIQYSRARIMSLLSGENQNFANIDYALLTHSLEWQIISTILRFPSVTAQIEQTYNFGFLCNYLFELCKLFSRWYTECSFKNAEPAVKTARLALASIVAENIKIGLDILGIESPEKM